MPADPHCYAVRLLNPVSGVMQVLAIEGARALSQDGQWWEIQVLAERPDHTWGSLNQGRHIQQFFRFGNWHPQQGLRQVPANPVLDIGAMQEASAQLIAALQEHIARLPFPLEDRYECWLLDRQQQPLALLAATTDSSLIADIRSGHWRAAPLGEAAFVSATLSARGIPTDDGHNPRRHAHELESLVRRTSDGRRRWFLRDEQGRRQPCEQPAPALDQAAFPPLGLREHWPEDWQQSLVRDYLDWRSPQLLTWSGLSSADRNRLEQAASAHALALDAAYPLFPRVINQRLLDSARVEARLRRSNPDTTGTP